MSTKDSGFATPATASLLSSPSDCMEQYDGAIKRAMREVGETYDLSSQPELLQCIYQCLKKSFGSINYLPTAAEKKARGTSGYNEFIKIRWAEYNKDLKEKKRASVAASATADITGAMAGDDDRSSKLASSPAIVPQEIMSGFAREWKAMSDVNKAKYKSEAQLKNAARQVTGGKKQSEKPLTGYQYFIRSFDRTQHPEIGSKDLFKFKAKTWSALSQEEKDKYTQTAKEEFYRLNPATFEEHLDQSAEEALKEIERAKKLEKILANSNVVSPRAPTPPAVKMVPIITPVPFPLKPIPKAKIPKPQITVKPTTN